MTSKFQHRIKREVISGKTPDPKEHNEEISVPLTPLRYSARDCSRWGAGEEGEGGRVLRGGGDEGVCERETEREQGVDTVRQRGRRGVRPHSSPRPLNMTEAKSAPQCNLGSR